MALMVKKKAEKVKSKIRWWKLKETNCEEAFRQEVTRIWGGKDGLPDEWDKTAEMLRKTAKTVLGIVWDCLGTIVWKQLLFTSSQ